MIIAEHCDKIDHHELQAARAEEERRILQEELWRQQKGFSWSSSTKSYRDGGITKIPEFYFPIRSQDESSSEDQNTILELSGRVQELQNEVNCNERF